MKFLGINMGYGSPADVAGAAVAAVIVAVLAFIAVIALTIVGYVKFLGKNSDRNTGLGKLFHFDHFYIEQVLRFLYLLSVVLILVTCVVMIIMSAFAGNVGAFFLGVLGWIIMFFVSQFFCRLFFEGTLINIRQAIDIRALRSKIVGDVGSPADNNGSMDDFRDMFSRGQRAQMMGHTGNPGVTQAYGAPQAYASPQPPAQSGGAWTCPSCGNVSKGAFCGNCGKPRM